jgi:K(+)-stimulated pyrophosphate-energized sodium pump
MANYIWVPVVVSLLAVLFAVYLILYVLRKDTGTPAMRKIADAIFAGATAFLRRQYRTIALLSILAAVVVAVALALLGQGDQATKINLAWHTALAFLVGALCSGVSGFIGMYVAVKSNIRTASAATRSLGEALTVALRGGAVSGFLVVALSLLGVSLLFVAFGGLVKPDPSLIVGFGFGASFVALFAQLGGGIYTKAADVGADLVGKVEASIPEDDPRNPAVVADLVGDNVGDCAGRGADLFESTAAENIGTMILGATLFQATGNVGWMLFPLVLGAFGIIASAIGVLFIRPSSVIEPGKAEGRDPSQIAMNQLNIGYYITCAISVVGIFVGSYLLVNGGNSIVDANYGIPAWLWYSFAGCVGVLLSIAFVFITQYYTAGTWRPVREIAEASLTGPATTILSGITIGFECVVMPALAISAALGLSYFFGSQVHIHQSVSLGAINVSGIFGTAVATVGMLMSCAYVLAMDTFGPITDNAGGICEMSGQAESVRDVTDALDSVGNTTKALTKGYGLGSAALAAFLLFSAYLDVLYGFKHDPSVYTVNLSNLSVFIAALIGLTLIFFFCSLAIRAVSTAAKSMIEEVRRQFREEPNIMADDPDKRVDPDYARCVDISTNGALRAMILPGAVAVLTPIAVGLILGPMAAAGMLMVSTMGGIVMALFLNNGGGAWDNAKKYIEAGFLRVNVKGEVVTGEEPDSIVLGKKSDAHKAGVIGDTVGDPFKDTAGPSLHVLIKLLSTITLVLAPLYYFLHP